MTTTAERLAWMDRGMCVAAGPERWQRYTHHDQEVICHGCPVREPCRKWLRYRPPPIDDPQPIQLADVAG